MRIVGIPYLEDHPEDFYKDEGCNISSTCLGCTWEVCKEDYPKGHSSLPQNILGKGQGWRLRTDVSTEELARLKAEGWSYPQLEKKFGMNRATIHQRLHGKVGR